MDKEEVQVKKAPSGKKVEYLVRFQQNRTFELYVGRDMFRFAPYGEMRLSKEQVDHEDFQQVKRLFSVQEV